MVATVAQASPATSAYCTPGFSTNASAARAITVTYIEPIKNEQTSANTSNPSSGSRPMRLFFTRWAKFLPSISNQDITRSLIETITIGESLTKQAAKLRDWWKR